MASDVTPPRAHDLTDPPPPKLELQRRSSNNNIALDNENDQRLYLHLQEAMEQCDPLAESQLIVLH